MSIITVRDGLALMPKLVCSYLDMQTTLSRCLMQGDLPIQIRLPSNGDRQSTSCSRAVNREQSRDTFTGPTTWPEIPMQMRTSYRNTD